MRSLILFLSIMTIFLVGCTDSATARRVLQQQGYTNIRITGYKCFACGEGDFFRTGFIAISPAGIEVRGAVCSGLFKNATIRFE